MDITLRLVLVKDTGRSYKFDIQKIGNPDANFFHDSTCLYISKDAFDKDVPQSLNLKVTSEGSSSIVIAK